MQHHFNTDIAKQYDYRKFYKDYYGIKFTAEYDIHHIGLNYDNSYKNKMLKVYIHTLEEIKEWVLYKNKLQIQKDNRRFNNGSI